MAEIEIWKIIVTIFVAVLSVVLGAIAAHYFNSRRDREAKRKEIITSHLINAFRILANDITRRDATPERDAKLELVISEMQLFGTRKQVELAKRLADDVANKDTFYVDDLLVDIRDQLRKELNLSPTFGGITWLRYSKNKIS